MRVAVVYCREGAESPLLPDAAAGRALAERCVAALLACAYPGVAVSFRRAAGAPRRTRRC